MFVKCLSSREFKRRIPEISSIITDLYDDLDMIIGSSKSITSSLIQKYIHFKSDNIHDNIIKPILLDATIRSEMLGAGSGDLCLKMISHIIKNTRCHDNFPIDSMMLERKIKLMAKNPNRSDIVKLIKLNTVGNLQEKIMISLLDKMSSSSPIFLEKTNSIDSRIEHMSGFTFEIGVSSNYIQNGTWCFNDVRCFVIDGFIESVSEIHHLLESASQNNMPHVIFARHISEDVDSTLLYNFKRGTLNIIPVSVGFDENTLNILNDISICTGSELVSSLKGDLISAAVQNDPAIVRKITISKNTISIVAKDNSMIKSQLRYLNDKRMKSTEHKQVDLVEIFDKRIKSLSSGKIEIKIGTDMLSEDPQIVERFDGIFRKIGSIIQSGVTYKDDLSGISDIIDETMTDNYPYSSLSVISAIRNSYAAYKSIESIDHVVYAE